jgi:hypothetical protein
MPVASDDVTSALCERAATRAIEWLEGRLSGGRLETLPFGDLYKIPFACAQAGKPGLGSTVIDVCVSTYCKSPGVFTAQPIEPCFDSLMRWYQHSVLLNGAAALGRWDVASPAALDAVVAQCIEVKPGVRGLGYDGFLLSCPSSMAGLMLLRAGRVDVAIALARFILLLCDASSAKDPGAGTGRLDFGGKLHMLYDAVAGEVVGMEPRGERQAWLRGRRVQYIIDATKERQHFYASGLAAALLSEAYAVTREPRFIAVATQLIRFDAGCSWSAGALQWPSKCKAAWGAADVCRHMPLQGVYAGMALSAAAVRAHTQRVTSECFLKTQTAAGDFGVFHFPLSDSVVERLPRGCIHWSVQDAATHGIRLADDYFIGSEEELAAEFIYELFIVSRGLARKLPIGEQRLKARL